MREENRLQGPEASLSVSDFGCFELRGARTNVVVVRHVPTVGAARGARRARRATSTLRFHFQA